MDDDRGRETGGDDVVPWGASSWSAASTGQLAGPPTTTGRRPGGARAASSAAPTPPALDAGTTEALAGLSGAQLLALATERLLAEDPAELPEATALDRARALLRGGERLRAATLAAVADVDTRQLFTLDAAGGTVGWLRTVVGGDGVRLADARRLAGCPPVREALRHGSISARSAGQLMTALSQLPGDLTDQVVRATLVDGIGQQLRCATGGIAPDHVLSDQLQARRQEDLALLERCASDTTAAPATRVAPAFVRLAERLDAPALGPALAQLLDALRPDAHDRREQEREDGYYLDLQPVLEGDWDLRGHLDPVTGQLLADELARRECEQAQDPTGDSGTAGTPEAGLATHVATDGAVSGQPQRTAARRRHDAFGQLLHDASRSDADTGAARPADLVIVATADAVAGQDGALPAQAVTASGSVMTLRPETLQRLGCDSRLAAVVLDAVGNPVGASHTRRNATARERRALLAQWGLTCAVAGCTETRVVPHHVLPWWLTGRTRLRDLIPICKHHHHDIHDGHRTLRLKDGRLIDGLGWVGT